MARPDHAPAARALALLRVLVGGILLFASVGKLTLYSVGGLVPLPVASAAWQRGLPARLGLWMQGASDGVGLAIVRDLLIPNGPLVAGSIAWLQFSAGLLLVLGLWTRAAALASAVVAGALALSASASGGVEARPHYLLLAMSLVLIAGKAGHCWGLDAWRAEWGSDRDL
ncbi:MAG: hypothetical protein ACO3DS_10285 [Phycisphaerales bacterium]